MLLAAMLVDALHAALEDAEIAFNGVGVDLAANVLLGAMMDALVSDEVQASFLVPACLIGHEAADTVDVLGENVLDAFAGDAIDMDGAGFAAALDKPDDLVLVASAALVNAHFAVAPDIGFVGLYDLPGATERRGASILHRLADTMREEPRRLEGDAQGPVKLVAADAL